MTKLSVWEKFYLRQLGKFPKGRERQRRYLAIRATDGHYAPANSLRGLAEYVHGEFPLMGTVDEYEAVLRGLWRLKFIVGADGRGYWTLD